MVNENRCHLFASKWQSKLNEVECQTQHLSMFSICQVTNYTKKITIDSLCKHSIELVTKYRSSNLPTSSHCHSFGATKWTKDDRQDVESLLTRFNNIHKLDFDEQINILFATFGFFSRHSDLLPSVNQAKQTISIPFDGIWNTQFSGWLS